MTRKEAGLLLLTSSLGDPGRRPLTPTQYSRLQSRVLAAREVGHGGEVELPFLLSLGCTAREGEHVLALLSQMGRLEAYLEKARSRGYDCITRLSPRYPKRLLRVMGPEAPTVLWAWGDPGRLEDRCLGLAGSRDLLPPNALFAQKAGLEAARQGYTLVTGGARGADRVSLERCLAAGGRVITVLPDGFLGHLPEKNTLYLCHDSFDLPFSSGRALARNHIIHAMGGLTLIPQCSLRRGGTWSGAAANLEHRWSRLGVYGDGSPAALALASQGAVPLSPEDLENLSALCL
ncbi:MAG: DNA-processing protein DprA [Clostridiales bacterium]|nr:DNA-processing protein DprA [Clostridiales bacterium]